MPKFQDLTGLTFNRLTVIKKDEDASKLHHRPYWLCRCECGNEKIIAGLSLKNGGTQSCGCLRNEQTFKSNAKNELNHKYGKLTVLEMDKERDRFGKIKWICQCECGNVVSVAGSDLRSGNTQSCGCSNGISRGELKIMNILQDNNISYIREYKVPELSNKRFDFALLNDNNNIYRLIEFDGEQHYKPSKWGRDKLQRTQESDQIKNEYALSHGIALVRIPYWELNNLTFDLLFSEKFEIKE